MSDRVRADLLREWRLAQQLDVTLVARQANLSVAQIQQLESGGASLFYSPKIKEVAARKVAQVLGGDPHLVIAPREADGAPPQPDTAPSAPLVSPPPRPASRPGWSRTTGWGLASLSGLAGLLGGVALPHLVVQPPPSHPVSADAMSPQHAATPAPVAQSPLVPDRGVAGAVPSRTVPAVQVVERQPVDAQDPSVSEN